MLREMALAAIRTAKVSKDYGAGRGLFDLDLEVRPHEVFGYVGLDGAGKTTTMRLLMGMIRPTSGSAHIFGLECIREAAAVKRKVGYLPEEMPQFGGLRGKEVVAYLGGMRGGVDSMSVRRVSERLDLDLNRRYREYATGTKRRFGILLALLNRPELLILDEPTAGLDPRSKLELYSMVREARDGGATVFMASNALSEVEPVSDRIGVIRSGRLIRISAAGDAGIEQTLLGHPSATSPKALES
jgi:ABC-2 type transport system ATP-binding protein